MNVRNHSSVQQTPLRKDSIVVASGLVRNPHLVPLRVVEYQLPKFPIKDRFQSELNKDYSILAMEVQSHGSQFWGVHELGFRSAQ